MIESVAERLAIKIKNANHAETTSVPVMKFALIIVINFVIPVLIAGLIGVFTGKLSETLLNIIVFVAIRMLSGGYHFEKPIPCILATTCIMSLPPHIDIAENAIWIINAASLLVFILLAPANMKGYNTMPEKYYPVLKAISTVIVASNFITLSPSLTLVIAVQAVSLLFQNKEVKKR